MSRNRKKPNNVDRDTSNYLKEALIKQINNLDTQSFEEILSNLSKKSESILKTPEEVKEFREFLGQETMRFHKKHRDKFQGRK